MAIEVFIYEQIPCSNIYQTTDKKQPDRTACMLHEKCY